MKSSRKWKAIISQIIIIVLILTVISLFLSFITNNEEKLPEIVEPSPEISENVLEYRPLVEKVAEEHYISQHTDTLLGIMMQESGGRGNDPMQASESLCGEIGCIDDPEKSIRQGVAYFADALKTADGDMKLAVQAYNFGKGFINYVEETTGEYTEEAAIEFSRKMYAEAEDPSIYSCLREGSRELDACYGDIYYAQSVMEYREALASR